MKRSRSIITAAMLVASPGLFACGQENNETPEFGSAQNERPAVSAPSDAGTYQEEARPDAGAYEEEAMPGTQQGATRPDLASYEQRLDRVREDMRELEDEGDAAVTSQVEERVNQVEQTLNEARQQPDEVDQERLNEVERSLAQIEQELATRQ